MDKKARKFVQHIREHLEEYGGKLIVGTGKEVNTGEGIRASGLFNDNPVVIRVAKNCKDFIGVLAHEYAHFLQWLDCPKNIQSADDNAGIVFFEWLSGKDYESRDVQRAMTRIMAMERDAERRAVSIIKHFDLNVDIEDYRAYQEGEYIQKAFPYLTPGQRELILTGITPEMWDSMFGE